jgi:hypothetical protein
MSDKYRSVNYPPGEGIKPSGALQSDLLYTEEIDGVALHEWTGDFVKARIFRWKDLVEDFIPLP